VLPAQSKLQRRTHLAAMRYADIGAFMMEVRDRKGIVSRALEFTILTAARTAEVLGARWNEIDGNVWTIPAERMKGGRPHRIPLCDRAIEILDALPRGESEFVFMGSRAGSPLGAAALLRHFHLMGHTGLTVHGFRSSFRDWAAETTAYPNHVVEMALAHTVASGVEAAYRRGDLFEKRRRLMTDWAAYCDRGDRAAGGGEIVAIRGAS